MTSTPYPDSIVIDVTIEDGRDKASCAWLAITRAGADIFYIQRDLGNTITRRFVDTNVAHNTQYCYEMALRQFPAPIPCISGELCDAFDCFCQIETCANTGPDPAFLGHGYLSSTYPNGSPVDNNEVRAVLLLCSPPDAFLDLHIIPAEAEQYVDSGTPVKVSGTYWCCWAQCIWLLAAQVVTPQTCILTVERTTWSRVKVIYR